jgi:small GTP-binding protein
MKQIALKFLVLGDGGVGKTTLLNRYVNSKFLDAATMTIGVEFLSKQIQMGKISCQLILWDISGQDRFRFMIDKYMRGASGALLLFDTTNMKSFVNIGKWVNLVRKYYENLPILLIAAKCDLEEFSIVGDIYAKKTKERFDMVDFIKTSSKTGMNVELAFETLANYIVELKKI